MLSREYETWNRPHLVLDTATTRVEALVDRIVARIAFTRDVGPTAEFARIRSGHD